MRSAFLTLLIDAELTQCGIIGSVVPDSGINTDLQSFPVLAFACSPRKNKRKGKKKIKMLEFDKGDDFQAFGFISSDVLCSFTGPKEGFHY